MIDNTVTAEPQVKEINFADTMNTLQTASFTKLNFLNDVLSASKCIKILRKNVAAMNEIKIVLMCVDRVQGFLSKTSIGDEVITRLEDTDISEGAFIAWLSDQKYADLEKNKGKLNGSNLLEAMIIVAKRTKLRDRK